MRKPGLEPLEIRTYRYKNPTMKFFCPLCRTERAFVSSPRLSLRNYFQLFLVTSLTSYALFPVMEWRALFSVFPLWALFEAGIRMNFRKEIPCPHCGFDAAWYKRDVVMARKKVEEFWQQNPAFAKKAQADQKPTSNP